ncbi:MAG: tRNA 4-thiouridine(8) synthase ThiI [Thermodesulfobacteriota bacterium]
MAVAYGIFSGGLDSLLAARLLMEQDVTVRLLTFTTPFFGAERAVNSANGLGLAPEIIDLTEPHLEMLRNPKHGFGRFANPCLDCHALMFRHAGRIMARNGGDFLFSGEVLGQRPKSQNRRALDIVARESGWEELILRPLSALNLPPTRPEREGLVRRELLRGFSGRTRKPQMELAARFGLRDYPSPAGGCLLTDPGYSRRLKELIGRGLIVTAREARLLRVGRHFRLTGGSRLVVGRNQAENEVIDRLFESGDLMLKAIGLPGPQVLLSPPGSARPEHPDLDQAAVITASYSDAVPGQTCRIEVLGRPEEVILTTRAVDKENLAGLMI